MQCPVLSIQPACRSARYSEGRAGCFRGENELNGAPSTLFQRQRLRKSYILEKKRSAAEVVGSGCQRHCDVRRARHENGSVDTMVLEKRWLTRAEFCFIDSLAECSAHTRAKKGMACRNTGTRGPAQPSCVR